MAAVSAGAMTGAAASASPPELASAPVPGPQAEHRDLGHRLACALAGTLCGLTQGFGLYLVTSNLPGIQGSLGATAAAAGWLTTAYFSTALWSTLLLVKVRLQFGIRLFTCLGQRHRQLHQDPAAVAGAHRRRHERPAGCTAAARHVGLRQRGHAQNGAMKPGFLLALLGLLVLQACGAPERRSSADLAAIAPAPQRWLATDGSVPVQRLWWQGFGDPVLARLVLHGDPFTLWSVGGSVLAPLFNGGRLRSLADASASRRDQALISYERSVLTAFAEVETQLSAYAFQREQLAQAQAQRVALEDALRIAGRRYREGFASYLDELLAQRNLFAVEQNVLQLQADLLAIEVNLYRALGGGWTPEDHATPPR